MRALWRRDARVKRLICWMFGHPDMLTVYEMWVQGRPKETWAECHRCGRRDVWVGE